MLVRACATQGFIWYGRQVGRPSTVMLSSSTDCPARRNSVAPWAGSTSRGVGTS